MLDIGRMVNTAVLLVRDVSFVFQEKHHICSGNVYFFKHISFLSLWDLELCSKTPLLGKLKQGSNPDRNSLPANR